MNASSKTHVILIALLWFAGLGAAGQFAKMSVIFPSLQAIYPDAGASLGFVVSLISFLGIGLGLFVGMLLARVSFRKLLLFALLLGACISFIQSIFPSLPLMLFTRLIEGVSHLIIVVAAPTLIAQLSAARHRNICMTLWSTFFGVAFAIVAWLGIPFAESHGASGLFIAHGIYMTVIASFLAFALPKTPPAQNQTTLTIPKIFALHLEVYRSPDQAAPALGWLFYTLTYVSLLTVLPEFVNEADRTFIASALPLSGIVVSISIGLFMLRYFAAVNIVILGFLLALASVLLIALQPSAAWPLMLLVGALGLVQGASFAAIPQLNHTTATQAHANGAMAQLGNLGNTLGTPIALAMLASFDLNGLLWFLAVCYISGVGVHLVQRYRRDY